MLLKESVDWENKHFAIVLLYEEEPNVEDKRNDEAQRPPHSSEPISQVVSFHYGCTMLCAAYTLGSESKF